MPSEWNRQMPLTLNVEKVHNCPAGANEKHEGNEWYINVRTTLVLLLCWRVPFRLQLLIDSRKARPVPPREIWHC